MANPQDIGQLAGHLPNFELQTQPRTTCRTVDRMLDCIHRHVFEPDFNVDALRRRCRIGDNNRSSRFRFLVGHTPRAYIEQLRLATAADLLHEHPEANVLDIAYLVGYEHPQTFYRAFRRHFGSPPGAVRKDKPRAVRPR